MFPLGGKRFPSFKQGNGAIQAGGKRVAQEVNSRGGGPVAEELWTDHGGGEGLFGGSLVHLCFLHCAFTGPNVGHPEDGNDQKRLKRQPRPTHPGMRREAVDLHVGDGHVDIGREDRDEQQGQTPTGQELNRTPRNEKPKTAQQFKNAAN
jgi:hypothetical protein